MTTEAIALRFGVAIGAGLLIGVDRERHKAEKGDQGHGIRTFAFAATSGAIAQAVGGVPLAAVATAAFTTLAAVAYPRDETPRPGLTTAAVLVLTVLLGALAFEEPGVAAALAVVVTILLTMGDRVHQFVRNAISYTELQDLLILAAAALVVFPLLPDRVVGPFAALNPRTIWRVVTFVMSIQAAGYLVQRVIGPRFGLPLTGFASGFVSSTATVATMGNLVRNEPRLLGSATAAATLATIASTIQLGVILATTSSITFGRLLVPLAAAAVASAIYGVVFVLLTLRERPPEHVEPGRPVNVGFAFGFGAMIAGVLIVSAALNKLFGHMGVIVAALFAGFADAHSPAASTASLVNSGALSVGDATVPILGAFTTNSITKCVLAYTSGGSAYALRIVPGLVFTVAAAWIAAAR
jgi:uncharacterized membrane protein (DUF4010 family)